MKLCTRARYGARALVEFALAHPDNTVSVKQVAKTQRISPKYLEQIMRELKASGLVKAVRGMHGGYVLGRPPSKITLSEVFRVLEGSPALVDCVERPGVCPMEEICPTRDTWVEMSKAIMTVLEGTTLQDLAERKQRKGSSSTLIYHI